MKLHRIIFSFLILVFFPGCASIPTATEAVETFAPFQTSTSLPVPFTPTYMSAATRSVPVSTPKVFETDTPEPVSDNQYTRKLTATITLRPTFTPRVSTPVPLKGMAAFSLTNIKQMKLISHFFLEYEHLKEFNYFNPEIVFSPDSRFLAFLDESRVVLWNINDQQIERIFTQKCKCEFPYGATVAFSPNGRLLATTGHEGPIVWDAQTGEIVMQAFAPVKDLTYTDMRYFQDYTDIIFSADGNQIITSSFYAGTSITFWNLNSGKIIRQTFPTGNGIFDIDLSPDGKTIFAAVRGGQVNFFDFITGERLEYPIESLCWSKGDCGQSVGQVCWEAGDEVGLTPNGKLLAIHCRPQDEDYILPDCMDPDSDLSVGDLRSICYSTKLFSTETWKKLGYISEIVPTLSYISFNSDGAIVAQALGKPASQVKLWNTMTREEIFTLDDFPGKIAQVEFSPNGQFFLVRVVGGEIFLYGINPS